MRGEKKRHDVFKLYCYSYLNSNLECLMFIIQYLIFNFPVPADGIQKGETELLLFLCLQEPREIRQKSEHN